MNTAMRSTSHCFFVLGFLAYIWAQEVTTPKEPLFFIFLQSPWNFDEVNLLQKNPAKLTVDSTNDGQNIEVKFNLTGITNKDNGYCNPITFGIMFKGDHNAVLFIEVQQSSAIPTVQFFEEINKRLNPKDDIAVAYKSEVSHIWLGTLTIPLHLFPRATSDINAYANYSQVTPLQKIFLLTIKKDVGNEEKTHLPDMLKSEYFQEYKLTTSIPNVNFDKWSEFWQHLIKVTAGGEQRNLSEPSRQYITNQGVLSPGTIMEQGLIAWILGAAIFCGILHVFVLSL